MSAIGCRSEKEKKDAAMSSVLDPPKLSMKASCRPQTTSPLLDGGERSPALDISHMSLSSASPGVLSAIRSLQQSPQGAESASSIEIAERTPVLI